MSLVLLLEELATRRIELNLDQGRLRYKAPEGTLTPALRTRLGAQKEALIAHLEGRSLPTPDRLRTAPSPAQERLWFVHQLQGPNTTYNIPFALRLRGALNATALRAALDDLVRRHQSLRSSFHFEGDSLQLEIVADLAAPWSEWDFSDQDATAASVRLAACADDIAQHCFDLAQAPLMRAALVRLGPQEHVLVLNFHHSVTDGWSFGIILRELGAGYEARLAGHAPTLPPLRWHYSDYIAWQQQLRENGRMDDDLAYWRERLAGAPACTTLPTDRPRPSVQRFSGSSVAMDIDAATTARLRATARQWGASLNHLVLAATSILLARDSGTPDLVIGLPLANRSRPELEPIIGMFVNLVPLRITVAPELGAAALVAQIKYAITAALEHCHLPFERLVETLVQDRNLSLNPIFQVAYTFLPFLAAENFGGLKVDTPQILTRSTISKYDSTFYFEEVEDGIRGSIEYATSLYAPDTAQRWAVTFRAILTALLDSAELPLATLLTRGQEERARIASWRSGPVVPLPIGSPWARFAAIVQERPDAVAVEDGDRRATFGALARRAEIISALLAQQGIGPGDRVGLILPRGLDDVAAMLGVARRGAAFVPFDPAQTRERLLRMAEQARLAAVVCRPGDPIAGLLAPATIEFGPATGTDDQPIPAAPAIIDAGFEDPLYMIFTSGSTGVPKAVRVPWRGLCNFVQWYRNSHALVPGDRVSQLASLSFDASILEIWPALLSGCTLVFVPEDLKRDPASLRDWLLRQRIQVHFSPTPLAEALLELDWPAPAPLRLLSTGGQALHRRPRPDLPFRLINNYGPTETSIVATSGLIEPGTDLARPPAIGRPIDNTGIAIRDESGQEALVGELWVSGSGVALDYFGDAAATAARFGPLPDEPGRRWYRTGDKVRLLPGGALEFIGRLDRQIKLRGYRIEAGDIESALLRIQGVRQAAVRLEQENLVAYLARDPAGPEPGDIRRQLAQALPDYMIPAHIVVLDRLPLQSSGKIDIAAIPPFQPRTVPGAPAAAAAPRGHGAEAAITRAWGTVLAHPAPGRDDNFFELGGHSLMLVRLKEQIRAETGRDIAVLDLFRHPTIALQARFLDGGVSPSRRATPARRRAGATNDIAIIGMAGRFPEAGSVEAFWDLLRDGRSGISRFDRADLLRAGIPAEIADRPDYVAANGILHDIDRFDAAFFGLTAREAQLLDPPQRLLLEEAWHAFEDAGYDPARIDERVGVFVGSSLSGYLYENVLPHRDIVASVGAFQALIANDKDFAATRIAYKLGLRGPGISVNTACSTSLVAIHQAVTALRDGQCELALAGGACVRSRQIDGYLYEDGGLLSRDGACRAFDAAATGMVGGNGVALVLLKPLDTAVADHDPIYAVIKGSAVNNDGADKIGFTAPSIQGQSRVISDALERAGVSPGTVLYVEAHGTGTPLGDPIEVAALAENYLSGVERDAPLRIGSVKTNLGHLDAAAGAAALIKTALCLHQRTLVPSLNYRTANPEIPHLGSRIVVCTETAPWTSDANPLRAAVSAMGIGGTNAHAVLEQAPAPAPDPDPAPDPAPQPDGGSPRLLLLSGQSPQALQANAAELGAWLDRHQAVPLGDVAYTLARGRRHWAPRRALCAATPREAAEALAEPCPPVAPADSVAFLFAGMGSQQPGMARALYGRAPVFTATIDHCANLLQPVLGLDIRPLLLADPADRDAAARLNEHRVGQPALFTLDYALARFWIELGLSPAVLIGHSLGEWVAACVAGVFALGDALRLVSLRGGLMDAQPPGAMLAVNLSEAELSAVLPAGLDIATVNAWDQIVVAGPAERIASFALSCEARQIRCKRLPVTLAAHSAVMEPAIAPLRAAIAEVARHPVAPGIAVISNLTGRWLEPDALQSPDYWTEHLRRCVRFADGLATLWQRPGLAVLECGPAHTLCNLALRDPGRPDARPILASFDGGCSPDAEWRRVLESAGSLWAAGLPLDLDKLTALQGGGQRLHLPGYAFQRRRYWLDAVPFAAGAPFPRVPGVVPEPEEEADAPSPADAPMTIGEQRILGIMGELLGPVALGRTSDFFLCGGDSLMAMRLAARIAEVFNTPLSRAQIMATRTPARIAALIEDGRDIAPDRDVKPDKGAEPGSGVVRLWQGDERRPPIVLIHAVGGGIFIYRELLQALATEHPVYGLEAPGLWDDAAPIADLRQQASTYHRRLLRTGVERPILIGGSSYGGLVAYELDRLYRQSGHQPNRVVLFDSPGPGHMPRRLDGEAEICAYMLTRDNPDQDFAAGLARMQVRDTAGRFALLLEAMRASVLPEATAVDIARQFRVFKQNLINMWTWTPEPHAARLLFFKATEQAAVLAQDPEQAWLPLAGGGIEILPAAGNHSTMLSRPHIEDLARELYRRISF
ncbi:MAG: amino acid adenylation domain-containing protein [Azospirillaceae bacterium]|nr:amino acid adenylation domain-containing protein [Azospirillaceae bacterium]